jgi:hypothetical protein
MKQFQKEYKVELYEGSAKLGTNINEAFESIIKEVIKVKKVKDDVQQLVPFATDERKCKC